MYEEVISRFLDDIRKSPDQEISIRSKQFWRLLGVKKRTETTINRVKKEMMDAGIQIRMQHFDGEFGKEPKEHIQIILRHFPIYMPEETWFEDMKKKEYESEMEIQVFFIKPLFLALGYEENDFSYDRKIPFTIYSDKFSGREPDLILYNGSDRTRENVLAVVEVKRPDPDPRKLQQTLDKAKSEALGYWTIIECRVCVATDGDTLIVIDHSKKHKENEWIFHRRQFKECWSELFMLLSKQALVN